MRILIIEDDRNTKEFLEIGLHAEGYVIDACNNGERGSFIARTDEYGLVICEHFLPDKAGSEVCKEMRLKGKHTPFIILSESKEIEDKIECFNAGADDYVLKPFSFDELVARIKIALRRPQRIRESIFETGDIRLESAQHRVFFKEKEVYFTRKEFLLLEFLMRNKGCVVTRGMILEHVWNMDTDPFSNTIETHIMNIRKKIGDMRKRCIVSLHGRGYKIVA